MVPKCAHPQKRVPNEVRSGRKLKMVGTPTCIAIKIWKITMFYRIEDTYLKQTHPYGRFKLDKLVMWAIPSPKKDMSTVSDIGMC